MEDLTGQQFGQWTVLEYTHSDAKHSYWRCQCSCGTVYVRRRNDLLTGKSTQCQRCASIARLTDLTGTNIPLLKSIRGTVGGFDVLKRIPIDSPENSGHSKKPRIWYLCRCSTCGYEKQITGQAIRTTLRSIEDPKSKTFAKGRIQCRCHFYIRHVQWNAQKRDLEFAVDAQYIWSILSQQDFRCALSGLPIHFTQTSDKTASVDRIDSSKGYVDGNIQWVHKDINKMKLDHQEQDFIRLCQQVADYQRTKNESILAKCEQD